MSNVYERGWWPDLGLGLGSARWFGEMVLLITLITLSAALWFYEMEAWRTDDRVSSVTGQALQSSRPPSRSVSVSQPAMVERSVTIETGESLRSSLRRLGVRSDEAVQAGSLVARALFPGKVAAGTQVSVRLDSSGLERGDAHNQRVTQVYLRPRIDLALTLVRQKGGLELQRRNIPVETRTERVRGPVGAAIARSIVAAGGSPSVASEFVEGMRGHFGVARGVSPSDTFDIIATVRQAADGATETGEVVYAALFRGEAPLAEVLRWGPTGKLQAADVIAARPRGASMWPVNGRFTSGFGLRFHPILGYARMHAGIDIGAPAGTPIYAVSDGTITFAGWHGGHGNYVRLDRPDGSGSGYAHMSRISVSGGQKIHSGQIIGYVGSTGLSTGPHLHYEVYRSGRAVDPLTARFERTQSTDDDRKAFQATIAALKALSPIVSARRTLRVR